MGGEEQEVQRFMVPVRCDEEAKALCLHMTKGRVAKAMSLGKDQFIDVDKKGKAVGLKVFLPNKIPSEAKVIPYAWFFLS